MNLLNERLQESENCLRTTKQDLAKLTQGLEEVKAGPRGGDEAAGTSVRYLLMLK